MQDIYLLENKYKVFQNSILKKIYTGQIQLSDVMIDSIKPSRNVSNFIYRENIVKGFVRMDQ